MPIFLPDYSKGVGSGLESMIGQWSNYMATSQADDDDDDGEGSFERAIKRRVHAALHDISPEMVRQIGYSTCLWQFNRQFVKNGVEMGIALIDAMLEKKDWTLEFVLAATEDEPRDHWDHTIGHLQLPIIHTLLQRYHSLFKNIPSDRVTSELKQDNDPVQSLDRAIDVLDRMKASFNAGLCEVCNQASSMRCSRCKMASYCGAFHQKNDWPKHKPTCAPSAGPIPVTDADKGHLLFVGVKKLPTDAKEAQKNIGKIQTEQRKLLSRLIDHTRNRDMVLYLHQLHLGFKMQPQD